MEDSEKLKIFDAIKEYVEAEGNIYPGEVGTLERYARARKKLRSIILELKWEMEEIKNLQDVWSNECDKKHCPIIDYLLHPKSIEKNDVKK